MKRLIFLALLFSPSSFAVLSGGSPPPQVANSPFQVSVGVTSGAFLSANSSRTGFCAVNVSANEVCFGLNGAAAVLNSGICLYPGGTWCMDQYSYTIGAVTAIAGAASSVTSGQEYQ